MTDSRGLPSELALPDDPILPDTLPERPMHPHIIYTKAYLDDPIRFAVDSRFDPESVLREQAQVNVVERDTVNFVVVELNSATAAYYPIPLRVPVHVRQSVGQIIDKTIKQLL